MSAPLLPEAWVDKIFHKLTMAYGRDFLGRWEGVPIAEVKLDWAECLACFFSRPDAIRYGLANLPDTKSPTAQEFRAVCLRCPVAEVPRLDAPAADPERVAAELAKLAPVREKFVPVDHKAWAKKKIAEHAQGIKVNIAPLRFARQALGLEA